MDGIDRDSHTGFSDSDAHRCSPTTDVVGKVLVRCCCFVLFDNLFFFLFQSRVKLLNAFGTLLFFILYYPVCNAPQRVLLHLCIIVARHRPQRKIHFPSFPVSLLLVSTKLRDVMQLEGVGPVSPSPGELTPPRDPRTNRRSPGPQTVSVDDPDVGSSSGAVNSNPLQSAANGARSQPHATTSAEQSTLFQRSATTLPNAAAGIAQRSRSNIAASSSADHSEASRSKKATLSLQAIIVVACALFAFVTSFVSFYVQYDFFITEYASQIESRMRFYCQMYGNQVFVMSNSESSSLAHITASAAFDYYDGILQTNPSIMRTSDFAWYVEHAQTLFVSGRRVTYLFPPSGTSMTVQVGAATVDICSENAMLPGMFTQMTWALNQSLAPWFPISAPTLCSDMRLNTDMHTILSAPSEYQEPVIGIASPTGGFNFIAQALDSANTTLFLISLHLPAQTILSWGATVPSGVVYYFDDNAKLLATNTPGFAVYDNTTIDNSPSSYVLSLRKTLATCFLQASCDDLQRAQYESSLDGFGWGTHELPLTTVSGRKWRLLLVDTSHSELTGYRPKAEGGALIAGATIGSLLVCAVLFRFWFAPLRVLAARVQAAGVGGGPDFGADNDDNNGGGVSSFSIFTEIARAQEAFLSVQESLQEIRSYIPQTLQNAGRVGHLQRAASSASAHQSGGVAEPATTATASGESSNATGASDRRQRGGVDAGGRGTAARDDDSEMHVVRHQHEEEERNPAASDAVFDLVGRFQSTDDDFKRRPSADPSRPNNNGAVLPATTPNHKLAADSNTALSDELGNMLPCRMTTLHLKIHRFAKWEHIAPFLEFAATCICHFGGVLDTVDYGSITATFNCHKTCPTHEHNAVQAAMEVRRVAHAEFENVIRLAPFSIGIDTDNAVALTVGFDDVKARVVIGTGFELARKLSSLAFDILSSEILMTGTTRVAVPHVSALVVDHIQPRRETVQMLAATASATHASEGGTVSGLPDPAQYNPQDRKAVYEVLDEYSCRALVADAAAEAALTSYLDAFVDMKNGKYTEALRRLQTLLENDSKAETALRKHAARLWNICTATMAQQAHIDDATVNAGSLLNTSIGTSGKKTASQAVNKYVRLERCPWDCLPVERDHLSGEATPRTTNFGEVSGGESLPHIGIAGEAQRAAADISGQSIPSLPTGIAPDPQLGYNASNVSSY